jgi:hypothetical protein
MGQIRPLIATDIPAVAALFQRAFKRTDTAPSDALVDCLGKLYLDHPLSHDSLPCFVHESPIGISGFVGRHRLPMILGDREVNGALFSTIMSDNRAGDPLVGPKLLKAALTGPQDFSFTETASDVSLAMGQRLGSSGLASYSLNWVRIIRPAQWLADRAARRFRSLGVLKIFAGAGDDRMRKRIAPDRQRWLGYVQKKAGRAAIVQEIDHDTFAALFLQLSARFALRPRWDAAQVSGLTMEAILKQDFGPAFIASVSDQRGRPIGCFFYHLRHRATARVLQLVAAPGSEGAVIDAVIAHAADRGAASVVGRTEPYLMEAMLGRRIGFTNTASSMINTRDSEIRAAVYSGEAMLNGLVGEQWSRLIGNSFD